MVTNVDVFIRNVVPGDFGDSYEDYFGLVMRYVNELDSSYWEDFEDGPAGFAEMLLDGMPQLVQITQSAFVKLLCEYAASKDKSVEDMVRGYVDVDTNSFLMHHGVGYDWKSADLFGGSADGYARKDFEQFCRARGIDFNYVYED